MGFVYDLSELTIQAKGERRISFQGIDMVRRHFWILVATSLVVIPFTIWMFSVLGVWALTLTAACYVAPFVLVENRTTDGMALRRYQAIYDARTSNTGTFILCNQQITPGAKRIRVIRATSLPVARPADDRAPADLFPPTA